ncbi:hypothetical protein ENHAE0001_0156 [Enhydrobacter aerosaccus SK60]|nr:hypothetical protein ENHAE0001_0156 [Enhydrobacter aerosaccus SK60]
MLNQVVTPSGYAKCLSTLLKIGNNNQSKSCVKMICFLFGFFFQKH